MNMLTPFIPCQLPGQWGEKGAFPLSKKESARRIWRSRNAFTYDEDRHQKGYGSGIPTWLCIPILPEIERIGCHALNATICLSSGPMEKSHQKSN